MKHFKISHTFIKILTQIGCVVGLALSTHIAVAQSAQGDPVAFVKATAEDLLETIKTDKAVMAGDSQRINALVNEKILPNVNLPKMTQSAVGRSWSKATPEEQLALQKEFRILLQRTYGGALSLAKDATLKMGRSNVKPDATDALVRTSVVVPKGEPINVDYRLEKTSGAWKVYDLNVAGSWLVQNYRGIFTKEIETNGIAGLIQFLKKRNGTK
jgi:phospholipid transport system substrate-binding protein